MRVHVRARAFASVYGVWPFKFVKYLLRNVSVVILVDKHALKTLPIFTKIQNASKYLTYKSIDDQNSPEKVKEFQGIIYTVDSVCVNSAVFSRSPGNHVISQ